MDNGASLRLGCLMACELSQADHAVKARLIQTTADEIRVVSEGGLPFTGVVTVRLAPAGLCLDARVRWRRGDQAGLSILRTGERSASRVDRSSTTPASRDQARPQALRLVRSRGPADAASLGSRDERARPQLRIVASNAQRGGGA